LDPLDPAAVADPTSFVYPDDLDTVTIQGYLGEVFAGLVAENFAPHGGSWIVPAFLFRDHMAAIQSLERRRQLGGPARSAPGRTGDDAIAFRLGADGEVVEWLFAEAKCTDQHNSGLVSEGHSQFDLPIWLPIDLVQLIEILRSRDEPGDGAWVDALTNLLLKDSASAPPRSDLFVYVCGRRPIRKTTWLRPDKPHAKYQAGKQLEAVEVHLEDFDHVLGRVYPAHQVSRPLSGPRPTPVNSERSGRALDSKGRPRPGRRSSED
jgi:hypothetical protein